MNAKDFFRYFDKNYKQNLSQGIGILGCKVDRYSGYKIIFNQLLNKKPGNFVIVETGCQRQEYDWGAGQSSLLFYEFLSIFGGKLISIDNNIYNLEICRKILRTKFPKTKASLVQVIGNSVEKLNDLTEPVDLIYLDSFDIDPENAVLSMVHHLKELASLRKLIAASPGVLIAVDDNVYDIGKGKYVLDWAKETNQKILHKGYQIVIEIIN